VKNNFIIYNSFYEPIKSLSDEQLGKLFRAIFNYTINGEVTQDNDILIAFMFIKNQLDIDNEKYQKICERNKNNGSKGGRPKEPKKPSGLIGNPEKPKKPDNDNDNDNDIKKENNKKKKFGEFKRVLLTEEEYNKLVKDFGEDFIKEQIRLLDEYVECNNNKNKYKNFNLVLRKSIKENWFNRKSKPNSEERTLKQLSKNGFQL
jgi:hypothetical protein